MKPSRKMMGLFVGCLAVSSLGTLVGLPQIFMSETVSTLHAPVVPQQSSEVTNIQQLLETTYLGHTKEWPDPDEPVVVLKKYVERDTHRYLAGDTEQILAELEYDITESEELVRDHLQSRHALARLAELYRNKASLTNDKYWSRQAAEHYIRAAVIGLAHGRIRYTREISELLVELNDKSALDEIFTTILT